MTKKNNGWEIREYQASDESQRDVIGGMRVAAFVVLVIKVLLITALCLAARAIFFSPKAGASEITPLAVAQSQIGKGEAGANNCGPYVRRYLNGRENLPWCAGFVSYCFRRAGYNLPYTLRAKNYLKYGKEVSHPIPGDVIVFTRRGGGHVGIVEQVKGDTIITIEGNTGKYPSKVKRVIYNGKPKNLLAYIRVNRLKEAPRG